MIKYIISVLVALFSCLLGKICGMGGGVIIKPVLDSLSIMSVSDINFVSSCTVLGMTLWSVVVSAIQKKSSVDPKSATPLGIGAAAGGFLGKFLYKKVAACFAEPDMAGGVQALLLLTATLLTLLYTLKKDNVKSFTVANPVLLVVIGLFLGCLGSFLGIGGGPFNMAVLYLFLSMKTKVAAQNSLYVILISQLASFVKTCIDGISFGGSPVFLAFMIVFGIVGSTVGNTINKKISDDKATSLLCMSMVLVSAICVYNAIRLLG